MSTFMHWSKYRERRHSYRLIRSHLADRLRLVLQCTGQNMRYLLIAVCMYPALRIFIDLGELTFFPSVVVADSDESIEKTNRSTSLRPRPRPPPPIFLFRLQVERVEKVVVVVVLVALPKD